MFGAGSQGEGGPFVRRSSLRAQPSVLRGQDVVSFPIQLSRVVSTTRANETRHPRNLSCKCVISL